MASGMMGIGTSGLLSAQQQLSTTGHNISNVNTEGFARQRTEQSASLPNFSGAGYVGTGTQIDTTRRFYNEFLEEQIRTSNSQLGKFEKYNELSSQIDNILANPDAGLTPTIEAYFNALQEVNDYPSSISARSVLVTSANTMVDRFDLLQERFTDLNNQTNGDLEDTVAEITSRARSIAELNEKLTVEIGSGNGDLPNDTLDRREQLIKEISERIDVSVVYQDNGAANIFIGSGQALVLNSESFEMSVRDSEYSSRDKGIYLSNETTSINITSQVKGGELQGLLDFKKEVLEPSFSNLGRIAASLSKEMNEQHTLGLTLQRDVNGDYIQGGNFFTDITSSQSILPSAMNTGTASYEVQITDTSVLTISDYELSVIDGGGGTLDYSLRRLSDGVTITEDTMALLNVELLSATSNFGASQGIQIVEVGFGAEAVGDTFLAQPTHDLSRAMGVEIYDVLDIALASPIVSLQPTDSFSVGTNTGTGNLQFIPMESPTLATNIPIVDTITGNYTDITVTYDGTNLVTSSTAVGFVADSFAYNPTVNSGNTYTLGAPYDNISFTMTGSPTVANDSFIIGNNTSPQDDNRNGLIMADIQTKKTMNNGTADFQRSYGLMVADVGTKTHSSEVDLRAQVTLNDQARQNRDSLSGVNLDEEASNLLRFQQAYQASSKVITVANDIFNTLLNAT